MIPFILIVACAILYWLGGIGRDSIKWAHTAFRDEGCVACMFALAWLVLGLDWWLLGLGISCMGMGIGDHEEWQWSIHAFVISLGMLPYAIAHHAYVQFCLMSVTVTAGTYLTSKFWSNKWSADVWCRGFLYATIPLWFLIK